MGFDNVSGGARSPLCSGTERGALVSQGMSPLPFLYGGSANLADASCRQFTEPGSMWAWGYNQFGHLGDGTSTNRSTPERIDPSHNWASVSSGYYESAAITTDGQLYAWGDNANGQLGDGTTTNRSVPVRIDAAHTWAHGQHRLPQRRSHHR